MITWNHTGMNFRLLCENLNIDDNDISKFSRTAGNYRDRTSWKLQRQNWHQASTIVIIRFIKEMLNIFVEKFYQSLFLLEARGVGWGCGGVGWVWGGVGVGQLTLSPWSSRSNLTSNQNLPHFELVPTITHRLFKLGSPNLDQRWKIHWLKSLLFWGAIDHLTLNVKFSGFTTTRKT